MAHATVGGIFVDRPPEWQALWDAIEEQMAREGLTLEDTPLYDALVSDMDKPGWARTELALDKMVQDMLKGDLAPQTPEEAVELLMSPEFADRYYWPNEHWFEEALFDHPNIP